VPAKRIMTVAISVGTRFPAYATSTGRVLLAAMADDELDRYLAEAAFVRLSSRTVTSPDRLGAIVRKVGCQGYAIVDQELEESLRAVAAPVRCAADVGTAAINVSAHATGLAWPRCGRRSCPRCWRPRAGSRPTCKHRAKRHRASTEPGHAGRGAACRVLGDAGPAGHAGGAGCSGAPGRQGTQGVPGARGPRAGRARGGCRVLEGPGPAWHAGGAGCSGARAGRARGGCRLLSGPGRAGRPGWRSRGRLAARSWFSW